MIYQMETITHTKMLKEKEKKKNASIEPEIISNIKTLGNIHYIRNKKLKIQGKYF